MLPTYVLARDHLQRAATILQGEDQRSAQLRHIIERTIGLMDEPAYEPPKRASNVLDFETYRRDHV
jgi:ABC-type sugar transport system ATPase subunit